MNMNLLRTIQKYLMGFSVFLLLFACSDDTWNLHYDSNLNQTSDKTLWDQLVLQDSLSDFRTVLDSVKVMNGHKLTSIRYSDLLKEQYFTVFAPVNQSFNKDSLLALCATVAGNKLVEEQFIMSHLSRAPYSLSPYSNKRAHMLNGKYLPFKDSTLADVPLIVAKSNIVAKNGLIHYVSGQIPYLRNIFESIVELPEFKGMGAYLSKYQKDSLDEAASLIAGVNDMGVPVYVDSVMIEKNQLLGSFGQINSEDSTYHMVAPSKAGWDAAYVTVSKYFNYGAIAGADSLRTYWTNFSLMKDLFFNWTMQLSPQDSLISNQYYYKTPKQHVFYKPYAAGGIFNGSVEMKASNGVIHKVNAWPYNLESVFFTPLIAEAESDKNIRWVSKDSFNVYQRQYFADSVSNNGYLEVIPKTPAVQTDITFSIPNTLSGKYDVGVVMLPKNITDRTDKRGNKFSAFLTYNQSNGTTPVVFQCKTKGGLTYFTNNVTKVDTVVLTTISLPSCNYKQTKVTVTVRLKSIVTQKEINAKTFTNQMYIDCLYLKPRQD
jgi:uncharacterized surface protein with fasciclin (FAS1) repeats